ncbi:hypothetical protein HY380_01915 [Candidatus Saccharibacteria bacterium]|nr:hypothetical protein [Candidatus Saccharibacteria bacterium]
MPKLTKHVIVCAMAYFPPYETVADLAYSSGSPDRVQLCRPRVSVDEAPDGHQELPVGIYWPITRRHPLGTVCIRSYAWSASNHPPYQRARNQAFADTIGMPLIAPNTIGQGVDSPPLTARQIEELYNGQPTDIGRVTVEACRQAIEPIEKVQTVVVAGDSQGSSMTPSIIEALIDKAEISHILWATPAGTRPPGSRFGLLLPMLRTNLYGQNMNVYRKRNPSAFQQLGDTKLLNNLKCQPRAHLLHYPALICSGELTNLTKEVLKELEQPEIHIFAAENDKVSPAKANSDAAQRLGGRLHELRGHYHTVTEYIPYIARLFAEAVGVETLTIRQP